MSLVTLAGGGTTATAQNLPPGTLPLEITAVDVQDGQLVALGTLGGHPFESPLTLSLADVSDLDPDLLQRLLDGNTGNVCDILSLELGAIHVDLLGLQVDTSDICLLVSAEEGDGNLLGNLLCVVAGLLDSGLSLEEILAELETGPILPGSDLDDLLGELQVLLDEALAEATGLLAVDGVSGTKDHPGKGKGHAKGHEKGKGHGKGKGKGKGPGGNGQGFDKTCDILNLSVGPLDLDLLGLVVYLDDCDGGPVTVDVTAEPGQGKLLGNLLCSLAGLLDDGSAIDDLLDDIADAIGDLL